ncbi:MAG: glucosidase [Bacteroidetes bacterium]|nr:glucosidase [Bacteroidota bacterium]
MNPEQERLKNTAWKKWGPYLTERQWGTVREDYSKDGSAWEYTTHDMARSKTWRWGEEGIGGFCDDKQLLCFAVSLWNKKDPILKERLFGLTGHEGNHGEDVKEIYYYLDGLPTHAYMKMLYKYPQAEFPYQWLVTENAKRTKADPEFEIHDTGIFDQSKYFDVFIEYAKADKEDILIKITAHNRGPESASLNMLPTIWFRNRWAWGYDSYTPEMFAIDDNIIDIRHEVLGQYFLYCENPSELLFCNNETNLPKLYNCTSNNKYFKDGINDYIIHKTNTINPDRGGTKASANYDITIDGGKSFSIRLRLCTAKHQNAFDDFDAIFDQRIKETNIFFEDLQKGIQSDEEKMIHRQALAGMLWSKQFYHYNVDKWLKGDPAEPAPPQERWGGRNKDWRHLNNADIISMPDKWEYPWYAAWDLAFHCVTFALIDPAFAKQQLTILTHDWYMHPNGQLPAYEWAFSDVNPPVHAWAAWRVYEIEKKASGVGDTLFLETIFHKLIINFTWWVNRKDEEGNNIFEGGFLGMDNIGIFNRNDTLPNGAYLEESDGTSWMATYSLNLMRISLELAKTNIAHEDLASKFFEHFLYIAGAIESMGGNKEGLWDEDDQFFYDALKFSDGSRFKLKVRSMVGLIPLFAVEVLDDEILKSESEFANRLRWFLDNRPDLASLVSRWHEKSPDEKHLLSLLRGHRMKRILFRMLDENEFLGEYGVRALSKYHEQHPYELHIDGHDMSVQYTPGESTTGLFGGNSNWRGPIWFPANYLIIESLQRFHYYYGDDFKVEYPTNSGKYFSLDEISSQLSKRLISIFLRDGNGRRPVYGDNNQFQSDPNFNNYIPFFEYFHGDNGKGLGASHQTGWTGLIAKLIQPR